MKPSNFPFQFTLIIAFLFYPLFCLAQEEQDAGDEVEATQVKPIKVEAEELKTTPGFTSYSVQKIEETPTGEGHLSDLLFLNPAVDFSRNSALSAGTASLRPSEISIHGQEFYQNLFMIDGTDTTSDINPAASTDVFSIPGGFLTGPLAGSSPQGFYIDVELLEKVEVYDSNIPVEYGGFLGGVVDAKLKTYDGNDRISWSYSLQRDAWEEFHITEDDVNSNDLFNGVYTPEYEKSDFGLSVVRALTENLGLTLGITQRKSVFAQQYEDDADIIRMLDYEDTVDNIMGKLTTTLAAGDLGISLRYTNRTNDGVTSTAYTGQFEVQHHGKGVTVDFDRKLSKGSFNLKVSLDSIGDTFESDSSYFSYHEYLESSGQSRFEGAYGDVEQNQTRFSIKPKWSFDAMPFGGREHVVTVGGEFTNTASYYKRPEDVLYEQYFCVTDNGREGCRDQDGDGGSSAGDEYLYRRVFYYAGEVELDYTAASAYVSDEIAINRWNVNLGLRADWGSYLDNFDIAPRVSATWKPSAESERTLTLGANTYVGRSFLRYQLNDEIYGWRENYTFLSRVRGRPGEETPCSVSDFPDCTHLTYDDRSGVSDLDSPYSIELVAGWSQPVGKLLGKFQVTTRSSKRGVSRSRDEDGLYYYTNDGESETVSVTADFENSEPYQWGPMDNRFSFGFGYRDSESNNQGEDGYDEQLDYDLVYYDGSLIDTSELPAFDFNIPISVRLQSVSTFEAINLSWVNHFNYKAGGTVARDSRENYMDPNTGLEYDIYADFEFDSLLTVNSQFKWTRSIGDRNELFIKFQVNNIFDKVVETSFFTTRSRLTSGRKFWIAVGSDFF